MTENSAETPSLRPTSGGGPGRLIRKAREAQGLSVEDLAAVIKLSRHTVEALERDDFATLKEPVYVRGYYRKLAKVLPLQEAELIASYDSVALPARPVAQPSKLILNGERDIDTGGSGSKILVIGLCAVAAIALGAGAFLFVRSQQIAADASPDSVSLAPVTPEATATVEEVSSTPAPAPVPTPATTDAALATPAAAPATDPASAATNTTAGATTDPAAPGAVATTPPATATTPAASTSVAPAPASADAPAAGSSALALVYSKDCWTRIEDADGKTLLSRIVASGETLTLSGKAPFAVSLGHAPGVQMRFNGTLVDMSGFTRSNGTARFSLP